LPVRGEEGVADVCWAGTRPGKESARRTNAQPSVGMNCHRLLKPTLRGGNYHSLLRRRKMWCGGPESNRHRLCGPRASKTLAQQSQGSNQVLRPAYTRHGLVHRSGALQACPQPRAAEERTRWKSAANGERGAGKGAAALVPAPALTKTEREALRIEFTEALRHCAVFRDLGIHNSRDCEEQAVFPNLG
jgi:hypothetical protein